jgi:2-dehydro-3-deoxyphosphogluconate aldolase/(4S)-4-hydroxy-2-oxoglutarate aldolase
MNEILKKIAEIGIVPVIKLENADNAVPLCKALKEGGLPIAEITFRTKAARESIANVARELPDVLVGAGTVLSVEQVKQAVEAGAKFIVSPGFNKEVVQYCVENSIPITPGCSTPTDLEMAVSMGLEAVKFFPAEASGGMKMLKAISAPYSMLSFIPTGGINAENLTEYLAFDKVLACGGTWMVKDDLINAGDFDGIKKLTKQAVDSMLGFELAHVVINAEDDDKSLAIAKRFAELFNMPLKEGNSSNFAGTGIEVNKSMGLGKHGHLAIRTNSLFRAVAYFERIGVPIDMDTAKFKNNKMIAVYLKEEIGGFAVHLLQK